MSPNTTARHLAVAVLAVLATATWTLDATTAAANAAEVASSPPSAALIAAANGRPASSSAVLAPIAHGRFKRSYQDSSLTLRSRLTTATGQPIAGAQIDILARPAGSGRTEVIGHAQTATDGRFAAHVPAGPSRTIDLAYRAYPRAATYAAQTEAVETVSAGVSLRISPRRTRPTGRIVLHGHVLGRVPRHGVVVEVLVYYHGCWEPIRTPRTGADGRFRLGYRFQHAYGTFPFRLRVRDGQDGFPYRRGRSRRVEVVA